MNQRILIIDDTTAIHEDYAKILKPGRSHQEFDQLEAVLFGDGGDQQTCESGVAFELTSAYQGREGLELVRQALAAHQPFAMAFVDMRMPPGWDGLQTIEHLWQCDPDLLIVICSAWSDYTLEQIHHRLGRHDRCQLLKKPFEPAQVRQIARDLTARWQQEHSHDQFLPDSNAA